MHKGKSSKKHQFSDRDFITELYQVYRRLMYYTARKYSSDPHQCDDIVQDSMTNLIRNVDTLKKLTNRSLANYIMVTVRNTAINSLKRQKTENNRLLSLEIMNECAAPNLEETLDDILIRKEQIKHFQTIWALLDEATKQILEGKYFLGYNDSQLAVLLGCRPSSVRMKLTRARRKVLELAKRGNQND